MTIPASVTQIDALAFAHCSNLKTVIFKGTPTSIDSSAWYSTFLGCTNLTDIKVPWAEGAVSGAPWGAANATIIYNYTGE